MDRRQSVVLVEYNPDLYEVLVEILRLWDHEVVATSLDSLADSSRRSPAEVSAIIWGRDSLNIKAAYICVLLKHQRWEVPTILLTGSLDSRYSFAQNAIFIVRKPFHGNDLKILLGSAKQSRGELRTLPRANLPSWSPAEVKIYTQ